MKLIAAQIFLVAGDYEKNIAKHIDVIHLAASQGANLVLFLELSLLVMSRGWLRSWRYIRVIAVLMGSKG